MGVKTATEQNTSIILYYLCILSMVQLKSGHLGPCHSGTKYFKAFKFTFKLTDS